MPALFQVLSTQNQYGTKVLQKPGVMSVGTGYKLVGGKPTNELSLVIGVKKKKPFSVLSKSEVIPEIIDGISTDIIEIGTPVCQAKRGRPKKQSDPIEPTKTFRPIFPGISIGHYQTTAGTFGCVVKRGTEKFILSNNHVLANCNNAVLGDPIYQPGPYDGGNDTLQIGILEQFVRLTYTSDPDPPKAEPTCGVAKSVVRIANSIAQALGSEHRLTAFRVTKPSALAVAPNLVDAALARPSVDMVETIAEIGIPKGTKEAELGMAIQKYGRTTKYTTGTITQINVTIQVDYDGKTAVFQNQLIAGNMSAGGDSGSAVLDMDGNIIGLLFAGSDTITIINPIQSVLTALSVEV